MKDKYKLIYLQQDIFKNCVMLRSNLIDILTNKMNELCFVYVNCSKFKKINFIVVWLKTRLKMHSLSMFSILLSLFLVFAFKKYKKIRFFFSDNINCIVTLSQWFSKWLYQSSEINWTI